MISLVEVSKSFGQKKLLIKANFSAKRGEKIAIIGKNGAGKSTLLKILSYKLAPDSGIQSLEKGQSIALLDQELAYDKLSVDEFLKKELRDLVEALKSFKSLDKELETNPNDKKKLKELESLISFLDFKDAWNLDTKIARVLEKFKLLAYKNKALSELSGGELRRLQLCLIVLQRADIILLDEPSNHLDVYMCNFLIELLKALNSCIIFISHDRYFIDALATSCVEIDEGRLRAFKGGYSLYLAKKLELLKSLEKKHENLLKVLKSEEEWLRKGVKARLKRNEGRKERLFKLREQAKSNPSLINKLKLELKRANSKENPLLKNKQKMLFELENISKKKGEKLLFSSFSSRILQGEKIAVVGKNGCGKSSFLSLLLGEELPDSGHIKSQALKIGYFDQNKALLKEELSIEELFCPNGGDRVLVRGKNMHIYGYLKQFLFPKELLNTPISLLSGGEKNRLALALLFTKDYDLLILDEPTNDLDINTINILEEYLLAYRGALIFVSHDRYFVDKIAHKLYMIKDEKISIYHSSYEEFLEKEEEIKELKNTLKKEKEGKISKQKSSKLSYKDKMILQEHPEKIKKIEEQIKNLEEILSDPYKYKEKSLSKTHELLQSLEKELLILENEYFLSLEKEEEFKK